MRIRLIAGLVVAAWVVSCVPARAALITGVTASSNMGGGFGTNLVNTVNGAGLTSLSLTANHAATTPSNSWVSSAGILSGQITFNLNGLYNLQGFSFWNQNGGGPGANGSTGIRGVTIQSSTDGVNYTTIAGAPTTFNQVPTAGGPPQIIAFGAPVSARFVRFNVQSSWGDTVQVGFAEAQFNSVDVAAVPEPTSALLLGLGGLGLVAYRRLRRARAA